MTSVTRRKGRQAWLDDLNAEQRRAVTHGKGHVLVVAGAGTGKTRTLAYRVAYLVASGVRPEKILLLTFTRRAAEEMTRRAEGLLASTVMSTGRVWGGTFHSVSNKLLRMHARSAGLSPDFTVLDRSDAEDLMAAVRHDMGLSGLDARFPRKATCTDIYSRCLNGATDVNRVLDVYFPWCRIWEKQLKELFGGFVARKQQANVLDYDDLLLYWAELVSDPAMARIVGGRFEHILVDEYQDTNPLQARILRGMRQAGPNIMAVGDDAQSIYSFRGATVRNMLDFPEHFPDATVYTLEQNYRSVLPILNTTNCVIAEAGERYTKDLWSTRSEGEMPCMVMCIDEAQQDEFVVKKVLEHHEQGILLRRQAVLFRAGHHSASLEIELTRRNIPFRKYGGLRFLEAAHVKDLVAFLRVIENPRDQLAWLRVMQLFDGIGPAIASRAVRHVAENGHDSRTIGTFEAPAPARKSILGLSVLLGEILSAGMSPAAEVERIRDFYKPLLEKRYDNPAVRMRDLESLEQIAAGSGSRREFLSDLQIDPPAATSDLAGPPLLDEDWLVLSTIHSAKGCEWDVVFLIHASDGCLPSDMSTGSADEIEEERRLTYVAMTRARDFLYVSWPMRYYHNWSRFTDRHCYAQPSRFLTPDVCRTMRRMDLAPSGEPDQDPGPEAPSLDIASRIRSRWE